MKVVKDIKFYNVYGLVDPITNEVFYVGCTSTSLEDRLRHHYDNLREAMNTDRRKVNKRLKYLSELLPNIASCILLETVIEDKWEDTEKLYIKKYRELNVNLTNVAIGGKGGDTYTYLSDEDKLKRSMLSSKALKGRKKPKGFAENLSKARIGVSNPAARKSKYGNIVKINNDNTIDKIYNHGFEIDADFGKHYFGNLQKALNRATYLIECHLQNTIGYWNYEHNLKHKPIVDKYIKTKQHSLGGKNAAKVIKLSKINKLNNMI
jgi:hypothetical protein